MNWRFILSRARGYLFSRREQTLGFATDIRRKLLLAATIFTLAFTIIDGVSSYFATVRVVEESIETELEWASRIVETKFEIIRRDVSALARLPWGDSAEYGISRMRQEAGVLQRGSESYYGVGFYGDGGTVVLAVRNSVAWSADGVSIPSYKSLTSSGTRVADVRVLPKQSMPDRDLVFPFVAPTTSPKFVVAALVRAQSMNGALSIINASSRSRAFVTDEDGLVLAHSVAAWGHSAAKIEGLQTAELAGFKPSWGKGIADDVVLRALKPIHGTPWWVGIEHPVPLLLVRFRDVLIRSITLLIVAMVGAGVVSKIFADKSALSIEQVTSGARQLAMGDLDVTIEPAGSIETRELARSFNVMAASLRTSYADLEARVREKTRDLADANAALEIASQHKSDFLAHMSHELRTPLNAVIGFSEMLKAQYFGPLNDKQAEYVRDINASGQHLLSLINDILDLAKVEAGRMELVRSDVHLPSVVEACCSLVSERFARKSQTLNAVVDPAVSFWSLDERKVKQCVLNLLSNANKFTPNGGRVALQVSVEAEALVLRVTDTGVGVAPDAVSQLFTEFYQVAPSSAAAGGAVAAQSTDAREGTGLGLALTKKFVELHGGTVEVASEVGKGSTFTLRFPAAANAEATATVVS